LNRRNFIKACAALAVLGPVEKYLPKGISPPVLPFVQRGKTYCINPEWLEAPYEFSFVFPDGIKPKVWPRWSPRFSDLKSARYWSERVTKQATCEIIKAENDPLI
jgi:hypothetical protein